MPPTTPENSAPTDADDRLSREETLGAMSDVPTPGTQRFAGENAGDNAGGSQPKKFRVKWYRSPVPCEELSRLNSRSDTLGFAQTLGFLGVLACSSGLAIYSCFSWRWYVTAILVFVNGHFWHFLINGFHELIHDSVFATRRLNRFFLRLFSFLGWYNHHHFWASHTEHHKYTLHPPADLEVVLPDIHSKQALFKYGIVNLKWPWDAIGNQLKLAFRTIDPNDSWTDALFPTSEPNRRRAYFNWARIVLIGHALIASLALAQGWWIVLLVISFPMIFGGWLHSLCNSSQHAGLCDNVPDFRQCCRTITLNPVLQFLYWHMNYHTEHHMYAAVPCYRLGKLHRLIRDDLPDCPNGLVATWRQIFEIQRRQQTDPDYQYTAKLPTPAASISVTQRR